MADLFFYGSLRDRAIRNVVLGPDSADTVPGVLAEHAVLALSEALHPTLVARHGAQAHGVVARGLSRVQVARLNHFEAAFAFYLRQVQITTADGISAAEVYFPASAAVGTIEWDFAAWQRNEQPVFLAEARKVMARWQGGAA